MKLSVALCTYNGERFLREQLDSIAGQTLLPDELVACDDGSKDDTLEILKEFRERAPFPVSIHRNEANLGSTENFEKAIGLCSGEVIALCDQDDVWKPGKLQKLIGILQDNPEAGYAFSDADLVDEDREKFGVRLWDTVGFNGPFKERFSEEKQVFCLLKKHFVTGATMAFRSSIGQEARPFLIGGHWIHDGWIALVASAIGSPGIAVDEPLIFYRQHGNQQIGAGGKNKRRTWNLPATWKELKRKHQLFADAWEGRSRQLARLNEILLHQQERRSSPALEKSLKSLQEYRIFYDNRRKILRSKGFDRFCLIGREAFAGRYEKFSNSWKSIARDLFL